jgi:hypothetical protein
MIIRLGDVNAALANPVVKKHAQALRDDLTLALLIIRDTRKILWNGIEERGNRGSSHICFAIGKVIKEHSAATSTEFNVAELILRFNAIISELLNGFPLASLYLYDGAEDVECSEAAAQCYRHQLLDFMSRIITNAC